MVPCAKQRVSLTGALKALLNARILNWLCTPRTCTQTCIPLQGCPPQRTAPQDMLLLMEPSDRAALPHNKASVQGVSSGRGLLLCKRDAAMHRALPHLNRSPCVVHNARVNWSGASSTANRQATAELSGAHQGLASVWPAPRPQAARPLRIATCMLQPCQMVLLVRCRS